eukprot:c2081_g1_i1.p1 GENE.c2081_g1_i1~~c2081_g1_i1.p1  ORF type:complete len:264 (+),score=93.99 c2081_g1_i1:1-792(+)
MKKITSEGFPPAKRFRLKVLTMSPYLPEGDYVLSIASPVGTWTTEVKPTVLNSDITVNVDWNEKLLDDIKITLATSSGKLVFVLFFNIRMFEDDSNIVFERSTLDGERDFKHFQKLHKNFCVKLSGDLTVIEKSSQRRASLSTLSNISNASNTSPQIRPLMQVSSNNSLSTNSNQFSPSPSPLGTPEPQKVNNVRVLEDDSNATDSVPKLERKNTGRITRHTGEISTGVGVVLHKDRSPNFVKTNSNKSVSSETEEMKDFKLK